MTLTKLSLLIVLVFVSCNQKTSLSQNPLRLPTIPKEAVWAGGLDGGAWILCKPTMTEKYVFDCIVYNDFTGNIMIKSKFLLRNLHWNELDKKTVYTDPTNFSENQNMFYKSFDGEKIFLEDNHILLPIKPL